MPEVELKLEIAPEDAEVLIASDLLGASGESREQRSTYFDTDDRRLFKGGFSLRIRHLGKTRLQTVKAAASTASLFSRGEWERQVTSDVPIIEHGTPLQAVFGDIGQALTPIFEVDVARRVWNVVEGKSNIEVSLDLGDILADERRQRICEIELELKDGDPIDLFRLARRIVAIIPAKIGVRSKAERGYRLLEAASSAAKAEPTDLAPDMTAEAAFRRIAQSCFRQFRLNESVLLRRRSEDALHQARVALRRLRSALYLFKAHLGEDAGRFSSEFRWLAGLLGDVRNLDVLLAKVTEDEVREKLLDAREKACTVAVEALSSSRASALAMDFYEWIHCGPYRDEPALQLPAKEFARKALDKCRRKLKKHGRELATVGDEDRHRVRKDAKKLRYASEFFQALFASKRDGRRYKHFSDAMETVQDHLGALNDLASSLAVLRKHGLESVIAKAAGDQAGKRGLIRDAQAALDQLIETKRFWR
ncbi:CYTH and CHAD domain-containing protein [Shinella zoogloeoides]|uniref:CYTH and CHAD domain-containing protein n=1 Tax=Shinella zoogloeoides TaxID=352475 RepID=UPI00273D2B13|nr:CYTH and CHAD domain-containing protein [Shinella zoogloeoides]WLR92039.1 CHAD domain-containing protein [Shinella zoogloeoides]